ncbi:MAG TPA: Rieske 2Fe-2S domain-containing protein [Candidatus Binatia bacterium]|nr:Rieske 2Fe-2S domain-containing protein [Candidatus Binatia bacterium]
MSDNRTETINTAPSSYQRLLDELPRTGPGTRGGEMLRRYWHPVCLSANLKDIPIAVRMLCEDLVLFRDGKGRPGLLGLRCPHRLASLEYGQVREDGLMCSYHGWKYDTQGRCIDTPIEPTDSDLKTRIRHLWYPVEEWGGVIWTYMGPEKENPPPLTRIDVLARTDGEPRIVDGDMRNYNYLNWMENFADMGHAVILHGLLVRDLPEELKPYNDTTIKNWSPLPIEHVETDFGMKTVSVLDTGDPEVKFVNTWSLVMPIHWRFSGVRSGFPPDFTDERQEGGGMIRIIDDTHFELFRYNLYRKGNFPGTFTFGLPPGLRGTAERKPHDHRRYSGWEGVPALEDLVLQESQGEIPERRLEHLGTSDRGVLMMRRIWHKAMADVAEGRDPKGVDRQPTAMLEVDTFHGHIRVDELKIGPQNMRSSLNGGGLIRDKNGKLVFD